MVYLRTSGHSCVAGWLACASSERARAGSTAALIRLYDAVWPCQELITRNVNVEFFCSDKALTRMFGIPQKSWSFWEYFSNHVKLMVFPVKNDQPTKLAYNCTLCYIITKTLISYFHQPVFFQIAQVLFV